MSEPPPPSLLAGAADGAAEALSQDAVDRLLADFRAWLHERPDALADEPAVLEPALDLSALLAPFVALRHEVNLQTKASRAQLEQNAQALEQLRLALDALRRPAAAPPSAEDLLRPLLKTLIDVHDALSLAHREVLRVRDGIAPADASPMPRVPEVRLPFWARLLGLQHKVEEALAPLRAWQTLAPSAEDGARLRQKVDALLMGYEMSLQRVGRALEQQGLERVACIGEPFDPESMEVAEVVRDPERAATEVIGELRPGYRWRGRLLRYAQVRVARP
jgi:molecular chaperone GrpE